MVNAIRKGFTIGRWLYQKCRDPTTNEDWYLPHRVRRVTPSYVFVAPPIGEWKEIRLRRRPLERFGFTTNWTRGVAMYVEAPDGCRIMAMTEEEPRRILGLPPEFTREALKESWRAYALSHHPDKNPGDPEAEARFKVGLAAYERLMGSL